MDNFKIIIYNNEYLEYFTGTINDLNVSYDEPIDVTNLFDINKKFIKGRNKYFIITTTNSECMDNIKLDETLMKRIAKYNKEKELQKIQNQIEEKSKEIEELDNKLKDREKRWEKVKEYIADIYDLDIDKDDEDDDYYFD